MKQYEKRKVLSNDHIGENVYKMVLEGCFQGIPGQFYMLRNWENDPILSRPLGLVDVGENTGTFLYMVMGRGTDNFSKIKAGSDISVFGPRGNGFILGDYKKVAIVCGSVGIAPMKYLARNLDCEIDLYAGFREFDFFTEEFEGLVDNIYISSDNGMVGFHGNVLGLMEEVGKEYDMIYACGPIPMLKALSNNLDREKLQLSMEAHMACGFGACLGCGINTIHGIQRVCHDGPVFFASEVDFNA